MYLWLASNKLTLNTKKTNFVIFHPYQKSVDYLPQLKIFDTDTNQYVSLEMKNYVKYLGILIDKNLSWKIHIDNVAAKLSKTVGLIAKLRHFVPQHTLLNIYRALILPYLSYGLIVWGQASKTNLTKILLLQEKVIRFILSANRKVHAIPLFIDANILPERVRFAHLAHRGSQSEHRNCFILPTRGFSHILKSPIVTSLSLGTVDAPFISSPCTSDLREKLHQDMT